MGDIVIKIGDYVTRISYNNDIIFKVVDIKDNNYFYHNITHKKYM